ncbi:WD40 repeat domain-containing serine/threonine protein kinase [Paludisphaera mucosa]|uniref:Protein kinase n=1 Tax=Paludisphaera mucosa TaxID=3030827 RepID=A0ABT6FGK1_9BACT|nr:protein kinase [Paludisphaera mucosa]MDG3006680.1 protein kinase [Paludisphaera mucosa]
MSTTAPQNESVRKRRAACERLKERIREQGSTRVEDLLAEEPGLVDDDDALLELILAEMTARRAMGDAWSTAEWEERIRGMIPDPGRRGALQSLLSTEMTTLSESNGDGARPAAVVPRGRIGRYHILEEIGRGGMGVVYKARQLNPGRIVAIKMILAGDHANVRERARLRTEAEAAAKLAHPNIVQILDADYHEGLPFLVMEFVDGGNLSQMLRSMPQPIRWSARLIETLARAIHAAHRSGIVHRDLNPTNILMTQAGVPKIGDFGLAKFLLTDAGASQSGKLLGTPSYMAPEQLSDGSLNVGAQTDVYALGAVLYEMLTGTPPYRGLTPMETLCQVAEGEIVPPSKLRHGLPEDLETICLKCLERNAAARYADARALADDLRRFQDREPIQARRTPRLRRAMQWASREPLAAAFLSLSFLLLLTLFIVSAVYSLYIQSYSEESKREFANHEVQRYMNRISKNKADTESEQARRNRYDHQLGRIQDHVRRGESEVAIETFDVLKRTPPAKLGFEWYYVDRLVHRSARLLSDASAHKAPVGRIAASGDGKTLVSGDVEGKIVEWDVPSRSPTTVLTMESRIPVRGLAVASDPRGRPLAYAAVHVDEESAVVRIWDGWGRRNSWSFGETMREVDEVGFARGGTLLAVRCGDDGPLRRALFFAADGGKWFELEDDELSDTTCAAFSAAADAMAIGCGDGSVVVRGRDEGRDAVLHPPDPARPTTLAFSEDGDFLATGWDDGRLVVWDLRDETPATVLSCVDGPPTYLSFCLGGRGLVVLEGPRTLVVRGLRGDASRRPLTKSSLAPLRLATSPDGQALVAGFETEPVQIWDLEEPSAAPRRVSELRAPSCLQFSPAGGSLFLNFDQDAIFVWSRSRAPHPRMELAGHAAEAWSLAFSADGRTLATGGDDHQIKLWDVERGTELAAIEAHEQTVSGLAFSPSGDHLASVGLDGAWKIWRFRRDDPGGGARLELLRTLRPAGLSQLRCVAYSTDGGRIAASGLKPDILLDSAPGYDRPMTIPDAHTAMITALAFSPGPTSQLASAGCDRQVRLWDPQLGDNIDAKRGDGAMLALASSPVDDAFRSLLAASGDQRLVSVLDASNRNFGDPVRGHPASIRSLAFSHDGLTLATGCDDGGVRLCDVQTRQIVLGLEGHHARINAVAFSPDDETLASCSHTGEVFLWKSSAPSP